MGRGRAAAGGHNVNPQPAPVAAASWAHQRERSQLWALRLMRWIALNAGRRIARAVLHPITLYFLVTAGAARRESRRYLERALRRPVRWSDVYRHVHSFACTVLDRVYLLQGRHELFDVSIAGPAAIDAALANGAGALLVGLQAVIASSDPVKRAARVKDATRFLWSNTVGSVLPAYGWRK